VAATVPRAARAAAAVTVTAAPAAAVAAATVAAVAVSAIATGRAPRAQTATPNAGNRGGHPLRPAPIIRPQVEIIPNHRITELDSGLRIVTEAMPSVRSAALGFFVATGSRGEAVAEAGLSHFLEHLLFRGTDRYASAEIDQLFDGMGAELNAGTDKESTAVYARMLDQHLPRAFEVMADMVWRPAFNDVDPEREVVLEEIAMYEDDPQDTVFDVLGEAVFGTHPLGRPIIGRAPVIRDTPIDVIAAAGSVDHDAIVELATRTLGERTALEPVAAPEPAPGMPGANVRFVRKDTEQVHVTLGGLGLQRGDDRRFAARVLDAIFGGLSSSRLFQAVREERGLAYSVYSFAGQYADTGQVGLYVGK
jgi:predicted Zn-dependent peptidase